VSSLVPPDRCQLTPIGRGIAIVNDRYREQREMLQALIWAQNQGIVDCFTMPPFISMELFERLNYLESHPQLIGSVHSFDGGAAEHRQLLRSRVSGGDWTAQLSSSRLMALPAACYPLYLHLEGERFSELTRFGVVGTCFRNEAETDELTRLRSFTMQETVAVGPSAEVDTFADQSVALGIEILAQIGLEAHPVAATDAFFGMAAEQITRRQATLKVKTELVVDVPGVAGRVALASVNRHQDHFARRFDLRTGDGRLAASACFAFGIDRIMIALMQIHGDDPARWPSSTQG
jgi:seryl-tRNA synthetase